MRRVNWAGAVGFLMIALSASAFVVLGYLIVEAA